MSEIQTSFAEVGRTLRELMGAIASAIAPLVRDHMMPALITGSVRVKFYGRDRRRIKRELRKAHDGYKRRLRA